MTRALTAWAVAGLLAVLTAYSLAGLCLLHAGLQLIV